MGNVPLTVADFMSTVPHTIGTAQPLAAADRLMREHDLRHLPVLDVGRLVGILSQRELDLLLTAPEVDADKTPVSQAMMRAVLVPPHHLVSQVAAKWPSGGSVRRWSLRAGTSSGSSPRSMRCVSRR
jgi:CBS domain-containing protein